MQKITIKQLIIWRINMKQTESKNIKIQSETLDKVLIVSNDSHRNLSNATEHLLLLGYEVYLKEKQILSAAKRN